MKLSLPLILVGGAFVASTSAQENNILQVATANGFDTLATAINAAGLSDQLSGPGPFTIFAPNEDAFSILSEALINCLLTQTDSLSALVLSHVVPGEVGSADLAQGATAQNLNGMNLEFSVGETITVNDNLVVTADIPASNGIVHAIDGIIIPEDLDLNFVIETCIGVPDVSPPDIPQIPDDLNIIEVADFAGFDTLLTAIEAAGLTDTLANGGAYTAFAPVNTAFSVFPDTILPCLLDQVDLISDILLYHVVNGAFSSSDFTDGMTLKAVNGGVLSFAVADDGTITIDDVATITNADLPAINGVIHVIDQILPPPGFNAEELLTTCGLVGLGFDIIQSAQLSGGVPTLLAAIDEAELTATLSNPNGPYTLLAPVESAFEALPNGALDCLLQEEYKDTLVSILTYHVLTESYRTEFLADGAVLPTVNGEELQVSISGGSIRFADAAVINENLVVSNGIIHSIDQVLIPPDFDLDRFIFVCQNPDTPITLPTQAPAVSPNEAPVVAPTSASASSLSSSLWWIASATAFRLLLTALVF